MLLTHCAFSRAINTVLEEHGASSDISPNGCSCEQTDANAGSELLGLTRSTLVVTNISNIGKQLQTDDK